MRKIWKEEVYRILSRKIIWVGVILLMVFLKLRLTQEVMAYTATIDGELYKGKAAIAMDKKMASEYAGPLTEKKIEQIYQDFGFYYDSEDKEYASNNYCSRFITEITTNYRQTDGVNPEEIHFLEGEDWEWFVKPILNGKNRFDYAYGWEDLKEMFMTTILLLFVIILVGLAPVFAEEYTLRTADLLLTTERGKKGGIWLKISAAVFTAVLLYLVMLLFLFGIYADAYGIQGLDASAAMLQLPSIGYYPDTVRGFFLYQVLIALLGTMLLAGMTTAVSSLCRNSFFAVVLSLILFVIPFAWMQAGARMLQPILGWKIVEMIGHFMTSMPVYLSLSWGFGFSEKQIIVHIGIALAVGTGCTLLGYHTYQNYQGSH